MLCGAFIVSDYSVLVVDDDADIRASICEILCELGYQCSQAPEGNLALCQLDRQPVELVIIDILMPERDGVETIQAIKADWPRTRIIIVADYLLRVGSGIGAQAAIQKPFKIAALTELVMKVLAEKTS